MIPQLNKLPEAKRREIANKIHDLKDFRLPELKYWNYLPCANHTEITQGCRNCGIIFRKHQRVGIAWLFMAKKALIADLMGLGKSATAIGLLALAKEVGEIDHQHKALIVCRNPLSAAQWHTQLNRMLIDTDTKRIIGTRNERINAYLSNWEVAVVGQQSLLKDVEAILQFPIKTLIIDDVDALRNRKNKTAWALKRIAASCNRVIVLNATPLQKRLQELHSVLEVIGGREIFGSPTAFKRRYLQSEKVPIYVRGGGGRRQYVEKTIGYQNISEFVTKIKPIALRRTAADVEGDVDMPAIVPNDVWLEFTPAQKKKYDELKTGIMKILRTKGVEIKRMKALAQLTYGAKICTGLVTLGEPDAPGTSCKLDWLEDKLIDGDLSDEKVLVFMRFKDSIRAMAQRLEKAGKGYDIIWGESKATEKELAKERFWDDPECKVLLGTSALEASLDLHCAQHLVNVDLIQNPARMAQLSGRIRRDGSMFSTVYVHNLLVSDSQEERYLPALQREQAISDRVWGEESELFAPLPPEALLRLITG